MTKESDFYIYLSRNRSLLGSDVASESTRFTKVGIHPRQSQIDIFKLHVFSGCIDVLESFDPYSIIHMFTADEMRDFQKQLNTLNNTHYSLDWDVYYEDTSGLVSVWDDDEDEGLWEDSRDDGVWQDQTT